METAEPEGPSSVSIGAGSETGPRHSYAFLVHSQNTLTQNLPPRVDNKMLARQKRRRTSPEDHAILEAEYQKNSKPDKEQRAAIVSRVALGEKEVQIWFQNRRQNDRRKSRPLLPHELVPHLNHLSSSIQDGLAFNMPSNAHQPVHLPAGTNSASPVQHTQTSQSSVIPSSSARSPRAAESSREQQLVHSQGSQTSTSSVGPQDVAQTSADCKAEGIGQTAPQHEPVEYLSNTRKRLFYEVEAPGSKDEPIKDASSTDVAPSQDRPSSLRLSMSLDGKAKVRTNNSSPSPPKTRAPAPSVGRRRVGSLQRSKSAIFTSEIAKQESDLRGVNRAFGRSRDSRTWEFFCDSDARDALSAQAERERRGSAVGAISLIRSQSKKSLLQHSKSNEILRGPLTPKIGSTNAKLPSLQTSQKSKPKISRVTSSLARMQADAGQVKAKASNAATKNSKKAETESQYGSPSGDSDKENWEPGTQTSYVRRRPRPSTNRGKRSILSESQQIPSHSSDLEGGLAANLRRDRPHEQRSGLVNQENDIPPPEDEDEEVAAFMRGSKLPDKEEDLDCIQGLLSLSQGAWR